MATDEPGPRSEHHTDLRALNISKDLAKSDSPDTPNNPVRRQPPKDHKRKALDKFAKPQDPGEGRAGTPRSQKIDELYTSYVKVCKQRKKERGEEITARQEGNKDYHRVPRKKTEVKAAQEDHNYADQLRSLTPKYEQKWDEKQVWGFGKLCTIRDFRTDEAGKVHIQQYQQYPVETLLNGKDEVFSEEHPDSIRWIHLPANNMAWVEVCILSYLQIQTNPDSRP
jgi:hypothetical protein